MFLAFLFMCFFVSVFIFIVVNIIIDTFRRNSIIKFFKDTVVLSKELQGDSTRGKKNFYIDVSKNKLDRLNVDDIAVLKDYLYDIFYRFETAYNDLDYGNMSNLATKQLFQKYYTGITLNLKVGRKKVINNINRENVIIYEVDSTSSKQMASAMICISYISYVTNKDGSLYSGNREKPITERFEVEFRKDFEQEVTNCPNCGAKLNGNKCDYCETVIGSNDFKISAIRRIEEK